jgi:hypothetical protein
VPTGRVENVMGEYIYRLLHGYRNRVTLGKKHINLMIAETGKIIVMYV